MKGFKKKLYNEFRAIFGRYVAGELIGGYIMRRGISDLDCLSDLDQKDFLDKILDKSISKFVSKGRLEEIRTNVKGSIFPEENAAHSLLRKSTLLTEEEITREPYDFVDELFGTAIGRVFVEDYVKEKNPTLLMKVQKVQDFINAVFMEFYNDNQIMQVQEKFIDFLKGKYDMPKIKEKEIDYIIEAEDDDSEELAGEIIDRVSRVFRIYQTKRSRKIKKKYLVIKAKQKELGMEDKLKNFLSIRYKKDKVDAIIRYLKKEHEFYDLEITSTKKRMKIFEDLFNNILSDEDSFVKAMVQKARLLSILNLRNEYY